MVTQDSPSPIAFEKIEPPTDFLTDFLALVNGKKAVLPQDDVFKATRDTLTIQHYSEK